jgi:putative sugar O-methyltransferase
MEVSFARLKRVLGRLARRRPPVPVRDPATLPAGAAEWLRPDNPHLVALKARYAAMDPRVTTPSVWNEARLSAEDMLYFRGDNHFLWQVRGPNQDARSYARVYRHLRGGEAGGLLDRLGEDDAFGVSLFAVDGRMVSRDLLDSVGEIDFLRRHAGLGERPLNILDIGAGYGRLAWRLEQATGDEVRIYAADAFAPSSFIAEYYLRFRRARRAAMVPLDAVAALLAATRIDVAVNVHSFSECTLEAIAWWTELLASHRVPRLMVVPNEGTVGGARCEINGGVDMEQVFARFGYRPAVREPRYADPNVQRRGVDPVHLHLFALQ